jgi:HSP90 family molecular chaperone
MPRRIIQNILKSYTGYFDVFNELTQNAIDAVEKKYRNRPGEFEPKIWILVDMQSGRIRVADNGIGMILEEFKFFLRV